MAAKAGGGTTECGTCVSSQAGLHLSNTTDSMIHPHFVGQQRTQNGHKSPCYKKAGWSKFNPQTLQAFLATILLSTPFHIFFKITSSFGARSSGIQLAGL